MVTFGDGRDQQVGEWDAAHAVCRPECALDVECSPPVDVFGREPLVAEGASARSSTAEIRWQTSPSHDLPFREAELEPISCQTEPQRVVLPRVRSGAAGRLGCEESHSGPQRVLPLRSYGIPVISLFSGTAGSTSACA